MNETNEKPATFKIPSGRVTALLVTVEKMARRSLKLGLAPLKLVTVGQVVESIKDNAGAPTGRTRSFDLVELQGIAPVVAGWTFVARVEHLGAENIVARAPGQEAVELPLTYRTAAPTCDHCATKRRRNDTFVLHEDASGALKQIGRNCLADFLRTEDAANAINVFKFMHELSIACRGAEDDEGGYGGGRWSGYDTAVFLATVASVIRKRGWVSAKEACEGKESTASVACFVLNPPSPLESPKTREARKHLEAEVQDYTEATAILDWAKSLGTSDYEHNLRVALGLGEVSLRHTGIVASAVPSYQRAQEREVNRARAAVRAPSTHFGEVGKRYSGLALEVALVRHIEGQYGVTTLIGFVDAEGRRFKWFASGEREVKAGDKFTVKGTVKSHGEYQGSPETNLSRCALEKVEVPA